MAEDITNLTNRGQIMNPYSRENRASYRFGAAEQFLHGLGIRTGYDKYHEEMDNASAAWEAQQQNNAFEEQYNSAEAQAERMRKAGLNPDISPSSVTPGEAAEFTEPESMPESPAGQDLEIIGNAVNGAAKLAMTIFGMYGELQAMQLKQVAIDEADMEQGNRMLELVKDSIGTFGDLEIDSSGFYGFKDDSGSKFAAKFYGLSNKNTNKFIKARDSYIRSIPGQIMAKKVMIENAETDKLYQIRDIAAQHMADRETNAAYMESRMNELLKKYPKVVDETILSNWKQGIFQAQKTGAEATAASANAEAVKAESEARKIYAEFKEIQGKEDIKRLEEYNKILDEGGYWGMNPKKVVEFHKADRKYRNAERRAYGTTSRGAEDYAENVAKIFK